MAFCHQESLFRSDATVLADYALTTIMTETDEQIVIH